MSEKTHSAFVQRAIDALTKYDELRDGGMDHTTAVLASGLYDALVKPDAIRLERDVKALQARNDD